MSLCGRSSCLFGFRQQRSRLYLSVSLFARVGSQRKDEANANTTCDLFVGFCDRSMKVDRLDFSRPCTYIIPLNAALWWQRSDPFIKPLNCATVSHWLSSSGGGRHHSARWAWQWCCFQLAFTLSVMSSWSQIKGETLMGTRLPRLL